MSNIQVFSEEDYKVFDKIAGGFGEQKKRGPVGWVQVYFNNQLHHEGNNLVVAQGRAFVAQKIFNISGAQDWRGYNISHFAIGSNGATVAGTTVTLLGPGICNTALSSPIRLSGSYLDEPSGTTGTPSTVYNYQGAVKPILTNGSIALEAEDFTTTNTSCTYSTKVKCTCVVPEGEPAGLTSGQAVPVSEAGLYFVSGTTAKMFARICFPPKWKAYEDTLQISWYILC